MRNYIKVLRNKFKKYEIDGYVIPKNDDFFTEYSNLNRLDTHKLSLRDALIPVVVLIILLTYNITIYGDDTLTGSNQIILLIAGSIAGLVGIRNKISNKLILQKIIENCKQLQKLIENCKQA